MKKIASLTISALLIVAIFINATIPVIADTGDIIDGFFYANSINACPGQGNWVYVDADGINNGGTYGKFDTMAVFLTVSGYGYPEGEWGMTYPMWYFFTADGSSCGKAPDRGRIVIYFVDMLASGFDPNNQGTWKYKSVPGVSIMASHDEHVVSGRSVAYQKVQAYKGRNQQGPITGTETAGPGSYTTYNFADPNGIMELYVSTDYAENTLNNFIIRTGPVTTKLNGDVNGDKKITSADALLYLRYSVGQNIVPYSITNSDDVTCDNKITTADALKVLRKAVGQDVNLKC